jgi:hypothetical protein
MPIARTQFAATEYLLAIGVRSPGLFILHKPFLLCMHGITERAHEDHLLFVERSAADGCDVLPELALI